MADGLSYSLPSVRIPPPPPPHTPLRSPKRRQQIPIDDQDPLLASLSPEAILDALAAINAVPKHEQQAKDILVRSMSQVSPDDRAIGSRAAVAAQKLKYWLRELQEWKWPTGKDVHLGKGFVSPVVDLSTNVQEYCGSLPTQTVTIYETRIEEIRNGIDSLKIEELKEHVMNVHVPGRSRPSSANSAISAISAPPFTYMQLSDFTAVITATILRALPTLARLNRLLGTWRVRLLVLRQVPGLLESIKVARISLDYALLSVEKTEQDEYASTNAVQSRKEELGQSIATAGLRMDSILDALETCEDSLPEAWIDQMDALEADFITWTQKAERLALEQEWRRSEPPENRRKYQEESLNNVEVSLETTGNNELKESPESDIKNDSTVPSVEEFGPKPTDMKEQCNVTPEATIAPKHDDPSTSSLPATDMKSVDPPGETDIVNDTTHDMSATTNGTPIQHTPPATEGVVRQIPESYMNKPTSGDDSSISKSTQDRFHVNFKVSLHSEESASDINDNNAQSATNTRGTCDQITKPETNKATDTQAPVKLEPLGNENLEPSDSNQQDIPSLPIAGLQTFKSPTDMSSEIKHSATESEPGAPSQLPSSTKTDEIKTKTMASLQSVVQTLPLDQDEPLSHDSETKENEDAFNEESQDIETDIPTPGSPIDTSTPQRVSSSSSHPVIAVSKVPEELTGSESDQNDSKHSSNADATSNRSTLDPYSEHPLPLDRDQPIQSIETSGNQLSDNDSFQPLAGDGFFSLKSPSIEVETPDLTVHSSPGVISNDSDCTLREKLSPQFDGSMLQKLETFQGSKTASLPLHRFINDETDASYSVDDTYHQDAFSTPGRSSDVPRFLHKNITYASSRNDSESPPPDAIPRRAVRGPSSSLMRGTISSLNKVVGSDKRLQSDSISAGAASSRLHPRYRALSSKEADLDSVSLNRKSSNNSLLNAPRTHLHSPPSMESINSYVSSTDMAEISRRKYSFSTDGGSFAMRPVNEADDDLQEKIHSILSGIPGQIRLSNNPASDFDQRSVVSSISTSMKNRLGSRSPFSTPSRAGTPTPSGSFTLTSRPKRTASKSEDKTVKVYHLHHRGNTRPTKLFVRTVGEDGERVMVRVGGGWADLREYLREYVIHHSRQTPSKSQVEVKGLPTSNSPGSTATPSADNTPSIPRPTSVMSNRPGSSLSVRKTRRPSKPAELPALTAENIDMAAENLPLPSFPSARRSSVSSVNSVSMSSILGDGSSVYSPHPGSFRAPHSQSTTPLGLAGPKPRTRHVSMTPESEAWVENVVGQARRTSANVKQTPKQPDPRLDRESHNSSRMSIRSVSDIGTVGRNKRVMLRGLGAHEQS